MKELPIHVLDPGQTMLVLVGVGGTGGYVLQQAARLLYALAQQGRAVPEVLLLDGDTVEEKNLLRQYFVPADIGKNKALVLAERYSRAYGLSILGCDAYLAPDRPLRPLVAETRPYRSGDSIADGDLTPIVVGGVDNAPSRRLLHDELRTWENVVYLDAGNGSVRLPEDPEHVDRYQLAKIRDMGYDGQVVCGVRCGGKDGLPFPGEVFPDLFETQDEADRLPTDVACGDVVMSQPQRFLTNLMAATSVLLYLNTLLTDGTLLHHRTFFNARAGFTRSEPAIAHMLEVSA